MAEYLAFGAVLNENIHSLTCFFVRLASEAQLHDSVLLIRAVVWDPWDGVGNSLLPPGNGKEELVLHPDPNAPHHSFAGNVVHETQAVAHVDPWRRKVGTRFIRLNQLDLLIEWDPNIRENVVDGQLGEDAVDKAEHAHPPEEPHKLFWLDAGVDLHLAGGIAHADPAKDQGQQLDELWKEEEHAEVLQVQKVVILDVLTNFLSKELISDVTYQLPSGANHNLLQWPDDFFSFGKKIGNWIH